TAFSPERTRPPAPPQTRRRGLAGKPWGSPALIGVPRFELGTSPTRTERATRLRHTPSEKRLAEEVFDRLRAEIGAFADQQVAAVGDHAQRGVQAARELEGVGERKLVVAGSPQDQRSAAELAEVLADVVGDDCTGRADRIARQPRALEEAV